MFNSYTSSHDPGALYIASVSSENARDAETEVYLLKAELERVFMITEALWAFVKEKHGYSDADRELLESTEF